MSHANAHQPSSATLPRPVFKVVPAKRGIPNTGGDLDLLITVTVDFPVADVDRKPLNLALVIDRSGSMSGQPLESAKMAAETAVGMLLPGDWISVVTYDDEVAIPVHLVHIGTDRRAIVDGVRGIAAGGSTDLYAGWAEGLTQVMTCPDPDAISRVVLLSDGLANKGLRDPTLISRYVAEATRQGVTTTTLGLGREYDESLLRGMADAGAGNYVYIESTRQVTEIFQQELAGLGALRGRNVRLRADGAGVRLVPISVGLGEDGRGLVLPDLVAGLPLETLMRAQINAHVTSFSLALTWDDVLGDLSDERRVVIELEPVDTDTFEALPVHPRVALWRALLEIAEAKQAVAFAARGRDIRVARERLLVVEALVNLLPAGDERERELVECRQLRVEVERCDFEVLSRASEKFSRDRVRSRKEVALSTMVAREQAWRGGKLARDPGTTAGTPKVDILGNPATTRTLSGGGSRVVHEHDLTLSDGNTVKLQVVIGDITLEDVDAIVNSTNRGLFGTAGVDGAVHRGGGPELTAATKAIGTVGHGEAVFTQGYALAAKYVIHTATPRWGTTGTELHTLARCYVSSLELAKRLGVTSIALPAIGTGTYGYPIHEAVQVAVATVTRWLTDFGAVERHSVGHARFVLFDEVNAEAYVRVLGR